MRDRAARYWGLFSDCHPCHALDDSEGEAGIETHLVAVGGAVLHVPLTYRGAPLAGTEAWLIGTMDHSVPGERWIYDGCADPVYARALAGSVLESMRQAEVMVEIDGRLESVPGTVRLESSGASFPATVELAPASPG